MGSKKAPQDSVEEKWRESVVFGDRYLVSDKGRVYSILSGKILKGDINRKGYMSYSLQRNKVKRVLRANRLVALTWIPNPDNLEEVNHKFFNKLDNSVNNLEWISSQQNKEHATEAGKVRGVENGRAVLGEKEVREIRRAYVPGLITLREIANRYGVSLGAIQGVIYRKHWSHLPHEEGEYVRKSKPVKRQKVTKEQMWDIVDKFVRRGDASVQDWCKENRVAVSAVYVYIRRLRTGWKPYKGKWTPEVVSDIKKKLDKFKGHKAEFCRKNNLDTRTLNYILNK